jgi:hypothetical protein
MTDEPSEDIPWEGRRTLAAYNFAVECGKLRESNPYNRPALEEIVIDLATEFWDRGFSQTEIKSAFEAGASALENYCAGEERRGNRERKSQ